MKPSHSHSGLSQILEESYKEQFENTCSQLATLANHQFLSHYVKLNHDIHLASQFQHLLKIPKNQVFQKFNPTNDNAEIFKKVIKEQFDKSLKDKMKVLSIAQLKQMATTRITEAKQKQQLSSSRKEKRDQYYERLKVSRKLFIEQKQQKSNQSSPRRNGKNDTLSQQSVNEIFLRLQVVGKQRDDVKKEWYSWGQTSQAAKQKELIDRWQKVHKIMKELLQYLLERLNRGIGTLQVFSELKMVQNSSVLSASRLKNSKIDHELSKTASQRDLSIEQKKIVHKFSSWFNRMLLDQRELEFIQKI